jgi:hypothetical protein
MNRRIIRLFLAGMVFLLGSQACSAGTPVAPAASPTAVPISISSPTSQPTPLPPTSLPPTTMPAPVLAPTDTPVPDLEAILKANGFERDKTLDGACNTACSAYKNSTVNVIADYYYTNKSFSLLYYAKDKNGPNEQAEAGVITKLLSELYPGSLSSDVMQIANDFPNQLESTRGVAGNYIWSVSIKKTYNLDTTIKQAAIYIGVTPG